MPMSPPCCFHHCHASKSRGQLACVVQPAIAEAVVMIHGSACPLARMAAACEKVSKLLMAGICDFRCLESSGVGAKGRGSHRHG